MKTFVLFMLSLPHFVINYAIVACCWNSESPTPPIKCLSDEDVLYSPSGGYPLLTMSGFYDMFVQFSICHSIPYGDCKQYIPGGSNVVPILFFLNNRDYISFQEESICKNVFKRFCNIYFFYL